MLKNVLQNDLLTAMVIWKVEFIVLGDIVAGIRIVEFAVVSGKDYGGSDSRAET